MMAPRRVLVFHRKRISRNRCPNISPQGVPSQEWNNYGYADPNAARSALIGAAVVGAVAVGLWAWQQHEAHQAQPRTHKRFHPQRRADANSIE
jgi:hypothetical protein